jgi:hypothetical protein
VEVGYQNYFSGLTRSLNNQFFKNVLDYIKYELRAKSDNEKSYT